MTPGTRKSASAPATLRCLVVPVSLGDKLRKQGFSEPGLWLAPTLFTKSGSSPSTVTQ